MINRTSRRINFFRGLPRVRVTVPMALALVYGILVAVLPESRAQSAQEGGALFEKRCSGCHALDSDHEGPRLKGVVGRTAGKVKTFKYSASLEKAQFIWDQPKLDKWLTDTDSVVPDNDMAFRVPKPEERAAIIAYLESLSAR
jgi:cytochrome c